MTRDNEWKDVLALVSSQAILPEGTEPSITPLTDPDGLTLPREGNTNPSPFLVRFGVGNSASSVAVWEGRIIDQGSDHEVVKRCLAATDFASTSWYLAGELLRALNIVRLPWYPSVGPHWKVIEAHFTDSELPLPSLCVDEAGIAVFVTEALTDGPRGGGYMEPEHFRLTVLVRPDGSATERYGRVWGYGPRIQ